jgi:hypothetical protein
MTYLFPSSRQPARLPPLLYSPEDLLELKSRVESLQNPLSPGSMPTAKQGDLEHQIFDALAQVKILTSQVAMHLDSEWRAKLFRQLDSLHDIAEWEPGDEPIQKGSFATFLRAMLSINPKRRPGLGLSQAGNLVAAWTTNDDQLTIEFLTHDRVRWVLSRRLDADTLERFAGETRADLLSARLSEYNPDHWFSNVEKARSAA